MNVLRQRIIVLILYGVLAVIFWIGSGSLLNVGGGLLAGGIVGFVIISIWQRMKSNRLSYLKGYILIAVTLLLPVLIVVYWLLMKK